MVEVFVGLIVIWVILYPNFVLQSNSDVKLACIALKGRGLCGPNEVLHGVRFNVGYRLECGQLGLVSFSLVIQCF